MKGVLFLHNSILTFPCANNVKKQWLRSWFTAPPSWIAWKKYQLYWATHERMWAMCTTSLSPNMGLCASLPLLIIHLASFSGKKHTQHRLTSSSVGALTKHSVYPKQQTPRNLHGALCNTDEFRLCTPYSTHLRAPNSDIAGLLTFKSVSPPAGPRKQECYGKCSTRASEKAEILTLASSHMIPCVVIRSAGSSGPVFKVCQIAGLSPAKI